jgi:hypothetical protein
MTHETGIGGGAIGLPAWEQLLRNRLELYGHRNWVVVADAAYPAQARPGIETILSGESQQAVIVRVLAALRECAHVRPVIHVDRELGFVFEEDAPGIDSYRDWLVAALNRLPVSSLPHEEIIAKLDKAGETFQIVIVKTTMTIPYTSVFFQLDCGYWDSASEARMRAAMLEIERQ